MPAPVIGGGLLALVAVAGTIYRIRHPMKPRSPSRPETEQQQQIRPRLVLVPDASPPAIRARGPAIALVLVYDPASGSMVWKVNRS